MLDREARSFEHFSAANAARAEDRPCECVAYVDIFTLPRWNAQGFRIKGGEHSVSVPTMRRVVKVVRAEDGTEEKRVLRIRRRSRLFCRCQVVQS